HHLCLAAAVFDGFERSEFQNAYARREQRLALQDRQKVAIERRVHLQGLPAVFDYIGVDETRDDSFAGKGLRQILRGPEGCFVGWLFRFAHRLRPMLTGLEALSGNGEPSESG